MTREEAIDKVYGMSGTKEQHEALEFLIPEVRRLREFYERQQEDERIRKEIISALKFANDSGVYDKHITYLEMQKPSFRQIHDSVVWDRGLRTGIELERQQKEQKPTESISQLTVQGKGVYKICPRCKERMVRDDSMVYTSMPPQYGYECPKCGEREFDTVMYDNPEIEEQKPAVTHGETYHVDTLGTQQVIAGKMPQKPAEWSEEDSDNLERLDNYLWMLDNYVGDDCAMPQGKADKIRGNIQDVLSPWLKSLPERKNLQPKQEWSDEDEIMRVRTINRLETLNFHGISSKEIRESISWLKSLPLNLKNKNEDVAKLCSNEWSEEDEGKLKAICTYLRDYSRLAKLGDKLRFNEYCDFLQSLRPSWKPSEEQITAVEAAYSALNSHDSWGEDEHLPILMSLINDLQKLL